MCAYPRVYTVINSIVLIIHCEKLSLLENIQVNYFRHSRGNENFLTSKKRQIMVLAKKLYELAPKTLGEPVTSSNKSPDVSI